MSFPGGLSSGHGSPPEDVCRHITHPFTYCRWEGCLCIDLDDRIVGSQIHCVGSETVVVGGSRTIPEAHNFAKRQLNVVIYVLHSWLAREQL